MKRRRLKILLVISLSAFGIWILLGYIFASAMTTTAPEDYPEITFIGNDRAQQVDLLASDGVALNAWYAGSDSSAAVILLPGIRANSYYMTERAKLYLASGYAVLMPDLRGTGKSKGDAITFGWNERLDLLACVRWLRSKGHGRIGVHGCSLGAATIAYSLDSVQDYSFVVMESCYDNIDHALAHRTFDSGFNRALFWPVYFFSAQTIGADADQLSPLARVPRYKGPLLYLAGDNEAQIPLEETQHIFSAFGTAPAQKRLVIFPGAPHCDLASYDKALYEKTFTDFFSANSTP
jgi:uncharacterized protein